MMEEKDFKIGFSYKDKVTGNVFVLYRIDSNEDAASLSYDREYLFIAFERVCNIKGHSVEEKSILGDYVNMLRIGVHGKDFRVVGNRFTPTKDIPFKFEKEIFIRTSERKIKEIVYE